MGRGGEGGGRAEARRHGKRRRTHSPRQGQAGRCEGPEVRRLHRQPAAQRRRQGVEEDPAGALLGWPRAEDLGRTAVREWLRHLGPNVQGAIWLVAGGFIFTSTSAMIRLLSTQIESVQTAFFRAV